MAEKGTSWTGKAADLAFVAACIALVGLAAYRRLPAESPPRGASPETALEGRAAMLPDVPLGQGSRTLLAVVSAGCRFCTESMPFYRQLVAAQRESADGWRLVFVGLEDTETTRAYLKGHGIDPPVIARLPVSLGIRGTPTLLVVGGTGTILKALAGRLDENQEREMLRSLRE